jgi:hypothetical protein
VLNFDRHKFVYFMKRNSLDQSSQELFYTKGPGLRFQVTPLQWNGSSKAAIPKTVTLK